MLTRRRLLQTTMAAQAALILPAGCAYKTPLASGPWVNDVHSQLNRTPVRWIHRPTSTEALQAIVRDADHAGRYLSIAGGRHAMGGQQFVTDGDLVDTTAMDRVVRFDRDAGLIEVGAGIQWPGLFDWLIAAQAGDPRPWTFRQKQTGADRLSIGGALAANVHGRGLTFKPFIADIESFVLVGADGEARRCSRRENPELFALAVGGYGLFGAVATVTLRLVPRRKVERVVEIADADGVADAFAARIAAGYLYGDFQFSTDRDSDGFLRQGVFSCYRPVDDATPIPADQRRLSAEDWTDLLYLGHADRARAFERYAGYYLTTSGQVYWSDSQQMSTYVDDYHHVLDRRLGAAGPGSEMISEIYVPRESLAAFLADARRDFRDHDVDLVYGTVRLIERDDESVLAWARRPYAATIFNLHAVHTPAGLAKVADDFRRLIDRAIAYDGSYYLTYHRWAERRQVEACYPQFAEFLRQKRRFDPDERFQSDWYRHYRSMFADTI